MASPSSSATSKTSPTKSPKSPHTDIEDEVFNSHPMVVLEVEDEEPEPPRVYGCRFCNKRFSTKQALGGHQNAHKIDRRNEKNAQQGQMPYPNEFFKNALMNMPYTMRYALMAPSRFPGVNGDYPGFSTARFLGHQGSFNVENRHQEIGFSAPTSGSTSSSPRPILVRDVVAENSNVQKNDGGNQEVEDDSGLDLTLRL